jgi:hypothetical protein
MKTAILIMGKGETAIRELMAAGVLQYKKEGGATLIYRDSILDWEIAQVEKTYDPKAHDGDRRRAVLAKARATMVEKRTGGVV